VELHQIPPGLWCVPSALVAITGQPWDAVIHPALNRHGGSDVLTEVVTGATLSAARAVLDELGYDSRRYRGANPHATVKTWARLSLEKYPGRVLLVGVSNHVVVVSDGRVYDSWSPHGPSGDEHPFATARATHVYLVKRKQLGVTPHLTAKE